jgi:flagellar hook-associated protein 2
MAQSNLTGLVSGLDSGKIIEATLGVKRLPIKRLEKLVQGVSAKITAVSELQAQLMKLEEHMDGMEDLSEVLALSGTIGTGSEDDPGLEVIGITANGEATEGTYQITVNQLATAEKSRSVTTFDTKNDVVKAGTIEITVDGETDDKVIITINEGDTLSEIADKINASDAEVNATLIFDGSDYRLQVVNKNTGYSTASASDALVITETYTGATGGELSFAEVGTATNADVNIDGLDMSFTSNSLDEVLEGITIELNGTGTTSFEIANDKEGTKENIQAFVDIYNETFKLIRKHLTVTENSNRNSSLNGDTSISTMRNKIQRIVGEMVQGVTGSFAALSQIGIKGDATGMLKIDEDDLNDAIDKDIKSVGELFSLDDTGLTDKLQGVTELYAESLEGLLKEKKDSLKDQKEFYEDRIFRLEERLDAIEARMVQKFSDMEVAISMLQAQGQAMASLGIFK